ncbi:MAG: PrpR N-terminal domain-containing protein [Planctomycetaceae bacterium]|nr:PrpR N-terminal domain-containing protein [Planctomycetaceae bacterium]
MNRVAFLIPDASMVATLREAFARHVAENPFVDGYSVNYYVAKNARDIPMQILNNDLVLSRGVTSEELKNIYPNIPIIEIPIGPEMAAAVLQATESFGRQPMAVIGSYNMGYTAMGLREILGVDIAAYQQDSREPYAVRRYVDAAIHDGRRVIICGPNTYEVAKEKDCHPIILGLSTTSICEALTRARGEMAVRRREREKAALFQAVLDSAHEGVVATDSQDKITAFNSAAAALLEISPAAALGEVIHHIIPEMHGKCIRSDQEELVVERGGRRISLHWKRVFIAGEPLGQVITLASLGDSRQHTGTVS